MARLPAIAPTILDRAIGYVAPERALARMQARTRLAMMSGGSYHGARKDRAAGGNWVTHGASANAALLPDLPDLRDRSRDLVRNSPFARGAVNTVVTNVVGEGLSCRPQIDREVLGLSDAAADAWERQAAEEWHGWADSQECDLGRTQGFAEIQALALRSMLDGGDCFTALRFLERPGSDYGLKLQLLEGDRICNPNRGADKPELQAGVQIDPATGEPLGYWATNRHPGDWQGPALTWTFLPAFGARSGQRNVLHHFVRLRPDQARGEPYLAPVIEALRQLGNYTDAELTAAVISSCFAVVTKTEDGAGVPLANEATGQKDAKGNPIKVTQPGQVLDLAPGESLENFYPERPASGFDPFVLAILRQIGVALELPFEILVKHFTASYSAARAALLEAMKFYRARRTFLERSLCRPVHAAWMTEAVARGRIRAPGFFADTRRRRAWLGAQWTGPSWGQIDPEKEINAAVIRMTHGVSTLDQVTSELTGGDWERNHRQRAKEVRLRRADGLEAAPVAPQAGPGRPPKPAENDDLPEEEDAA